MIELTDEEYEALAALAYRGATTSEHQLGVDAFLQSIDRRNGRTRHLLWVLWQETDTPLPSKAVFPTTWPPELKRKIERLDRPVARVDVDAVLATQARRPAGVYVTNDPAGLVGWTTLATWFANP